MKVVLSCIRMFLLMFIGLFIFSGLVYSINPPKPYGAIPSKQQLEWHEMEIYSMVNFSTITFCGKEWGYGNESPQLFNPSEFDALQIVRAAKKAGIKGFIIDAKHHGGFCLWPSKYNKNYSVKNSPWKKGKGDMVKEFADACRQENVKFGFYLSPWDRNHKDYGNMKYLECYKNQLRELLTDYGEVFQVWLDGANGGDGYYGGANETRSIIGKEYYPLQEWYKLIRELQPNAVIFSDCGPDIRWNGNESGYSGTNCWATISNQQWNDQDYTKMANGEMNGDNWCPAEADFPLHLQPKGWFWHPGSKPATLEQLIDIYFNSVGRNSSMDIGLAPDRRGLLCEEDCRVLQEFGDRIHEIFSDNLIRNAEIEASNVRGNDLTYSASNVALKTDKHWSVDRKYWATDDTIKTATLTFKFPSPIAFNIIDMREYIPLGHRINKWCIEVSYNNKWYEVGSGEGVGARRLWRGPMITTEQIRIRFEDSMACPVVSEIGIYKE